MLVFHNLVATASRRLQAFAIQNLDMATAVVDQLALMQGVGGLRHTDPAYAQQVGKKFMGQQKGVRMNAVAGGGLGYRRPISMQR